jgi:hypothetical protein
VKRGWWRTTIVVASLVSYGSAAFAQNDPSVQPIAPAQPPPQPAYPPPNYYPPPQPYRVYPPAGPARLRYEEGDPIPPGYHVVQRARQGPVIAGTIVFSVSYGIALSAAMINDFDDQTQWLAIPVAGPWLMMWDRSRPQCNSQTGSGCVEESLETVLRFYLAFDGIAQAVGVGLLAFGVAGRKILVRDDSYARVRFTPTRIGSTGYGAVLSGRF